MYKAQNFRIISGMCKRSIVWIRYTTYMS